MPIIATFSTAIAFIREAYQVGLDRTDELVEDCLMRLVYAGRLLDTYRIEKECCEACRLKVEKLRQELIRAEGRRREMRTSHV